MPDLDPATCLAEYTSRGPRYTSYPPATEFGPVSAERVMYELASIGERREPVSLYVHVPLCKSLCWYCGCNYHRASRRASEAIDEASRFSLTI